MPKARSPSGSFVIDDDPSMLIRPPGATPMVPSLLNAVGAAPPMPTVPFTVRVPEFMIGPSRVSAGSPDVPAESTVSDPSFCNPDDTVKPDLRWRWRRRGWWSRWRWWRWRRRYRW